MPCGCEVGKEMGVNTWAAFAGTDDNAVVDGDFAVLEDELQPVLKSLRACRHQHRRHSQHMTDESHASCSSTIGERVRRQSLPPP